MALKRVGSRLVAEGAGQYIAQMGQAATATRQVGQAANEAQGGLNNLNFRSLTLASTLGSLLASAIQKVLGGLLQLGRQALNEVTSFERLTFAMESLVARELRTFDSTLSMADALEQAGPAAQGLLQWIQKLAIESPFDVDSVAQAFKTAQAYGFTAGEAMKLTQVMIDFASATGATGDVMGRAALALGQIRAKGKLAGQEILQLVNAGINVNAILGTMGFTLNDVSNGLVSADAFIKAFSDTMENDFGGAAKRSMGTIGGLLNALSDLRAIGLREFFTPLFQEVQPYLAAFVTKLQELMPIISYLGSLVGKLTSFVIENREAILRTVAAVGAAVAAFFLIINAGTIFTAVAGLVTGALTAIAAAVTFLMSPLGLLAVVVAGLAGLFIFSFSEIEFSASSFFSNFGSNMFSYGRDLVLAFAEGMATAINYILDVLIQIGNIIASWLAPGSPPKLLPNIDDWGTDAMNEYLKGFLNADFSIFNKLSGIVSRFIRSLQLPETEVIPRILGARSSIAEAIEQLKKTGNVGKEAIQKIMDAIGITDPALEGYISAMVRAEAASQAVKAAQERLNKVSQEYAKILQPMNDELDAIGQRRQEVIDQQRKAELEAILADENAPALAKELALMELREIELKKTIAATEDERDAKLDAEQAALDKAKAEEEAAQTQLALQEAMIAVQTENNELIKQQIALLERLNKEASSGGGGAKEKAGGAGVPSIPSLPSIPTDFGALGGGFGGLLDGLTERIQGFLGEIAAPFDGIGEKLTTLQTTWGQVFTNIANLPIWQTIKDKFEGISFEDVIKGIVGIGIALAFPGLLPAIAIFGVAWSQNWGDIQGTLTEVWEGIILPKLQQLQQWLETNIPIALQTLSQFWTNVLLPAIQSVWSWISGTLMPFITGTVIPILGGILGAELQILGGVWENVLLPAIRNVWSFVSGTLMPFITGTVIPIIQTTLAMALQVLTKAWEEILLPAIKAVWGFIQDSLVPLFRAVVELLEVTMTLALTVLQGAWENILLPAIKSVWEFVQDNLIPIFEDVWKLIQDNLVPIIESLTEKLGSPLQLVLDTVILLVDGFKAGLDGVSTTIGIVIGWIEDLIESLGNIEIPEILTPGSPTPFEMGLRGIIASMVDLNTLIPIVNGNMRNMGAAAADAMEDALSMELGFLKIVPGAMRLAESLGEQLEHSFSGGLNNAVHIPVTHPAMAGAHGGTTINQNRVTGVENVNVADGLDWNMLVNMLHQVMNEQFPSQV